MHKYNVKKFRFITELNTFIADARKLRKFKAEDFTIINKKTTNERHVTYVGDFYMRGEFVGWKFHMFDEEGELISHVMVYND